MARGELRTGVENLAEYTRSVRKSLLNSFRFSLFKRGSADVRSGNEKTANR
jgi:hypothetical protein